MLSTPQRTSHIQDRMSCLIFRPWQAMSRASRYTPERHTICHFEKRSEEKSQALCRLRFTKNKLRFLPPVEMTKVCWHFQLVPGLRPGTKNSDSSGKLFIPQRPHFWVYRISLSRSFVRGSGQTKPSALFEERFRRNVFVRENRRAGSLIFYGLAGTQSLCPGISRHNREMTWILVEKGSILKLTWLYCK